jgi:hypothetical protein
MNNAELLASLSTEELQNLVNLAQNVQINNETTILPTPIFDDLESTTNKERKNNNARFIKKLTRYDGGKWTKGGATNKTIIQELKRSTIDANQLVQQLYKDGEKLRITARAATELYEDISTILEEDNAEITKQQILFLREKCHVLATYSYSIGKEMDDEAKKVTTANIKLPTTMRHLNDNEEEDKELVFSNDEIELLHQERFHERLLQQNAYKRGYSNGNGFNNYRRPTTRGNTQHFNRQPSRGNFFGRNKQQHYQQQQQQTTQPNYQQQQNLHQPNN